MELFIDVSQISQVQLTLSMSIQQNKVSLTTLFSEWVSDLVRKLSDESFEVQGVVLVGLVDLLDGPKDVFVFFMKPKCLSCH